MNIKHNLNHVIKSMDDFSSKTNMVAINASIRASKLSTSEGAAFQILAREIQSMSSASKDKLEEIHSLINDIAVLSKLINKTGGQRLLLMRIVNAMILGNEKAQEGAMETFNNHLYDIECSTINTEESLALIERLKMEWIGFQHELITWSPQQATDQANDMIDTINLLIKEYEKYAGE